MDDDPLWSAAPFWSAAVTIVVMSRALDAANAHWDPMAQTWARLSKVAEESGEVISAYIGVTGQNPRKGKYASMSDVKKELLDVAVTALLAYEHVDHHQGVVLNALLDHIEFVRKRASNE